jgi:hypothetical protein
MDKEKIFNQGNTIGLVNLITAGSFIISILLIIIIIIN